MAETKVYDHLDKLPAKTRDWGETAQIAVLSVIILVFFAIAASSGLGLLSSVIHH